jgi:uncharacterized protein
MSRTRAPQRAGRGSTLGRRRPRLSRREILIRAGPFAVRARLLDSPTADRIWQALPIYATAQMWCGALTFESPLEPGFECEARDQLAPGEIASWTGKGRVLIACGPSEVLQPGSCSVWALALDDVTALAEVHSGDRVAVLEADS